MSPRSVAAMLKFCANLSFMFTEKPFLERYQAAKNAGFKAVESGFPFGISPEQVVEAKNKSGIQQILINVYTGDVTKGELGFAALPGKEEEFKKSISTTIKLAVELGAKKIHVMSGKLQGDSTAENDITYEKNLRHAAAAFEKANILGLIEPINNYSVPNYYMNSYDKAVEIVKKINSPNLKVMFDIFHLQHIKGDLTNTIKKHASYIGHVQIAQVPNRNEPNTPGEVNYKYVFDVLKSVGYDDWIGLEYKPLADPVVGLKWINEFGYSL